MLEQITFFFISKPKRMIFVGELLFKAGAAIIVLAFLANVGTSAIEHIGGLTGQPATAKSLAEIYPTLPTWWIPESFVGAIPAIFMVITGLWLIVSGRQINKHIRCFH